ISLHELVRDANGVIPVLEIDAIVSPSGNVERAAVARVDQRPRLALLLLLALDEVHNIRVIYIEQNHFCCSSCFTSAFNGSSELIETAHERERAGRRAAALQRLFGAAKGRKIGSRAAAELEQHPFGLRQRQDRLHRVLDAVDEASRGLRAGLGGEADVEPDGG